MVANSCGPVIGSAAHRAMAAMARKVAGCSPAVSSGARPKVSHPPRSTRSITSTGSASPAKGGPAHRKRPVNGWQNAAVSVSSVRCTRMATIAAGVFGSSSKAGPGARGIRKPPPGAPGAMYSSNSAEAGVGT